jgi:hypothetical protein
MLDRPAREEQARDLVVRALAESPDPQAEEALVRRVNEQGAAGPVPAAVVRRQLVDLEATGHAARGPNGWTRTARPYTESETDAHTLEALVGPETHATLAAAGFAGLADLAGRPDELRERSPELRGSGPRPPTSSSRPPPSCSRRAPPGRARGATPT